MIQPNDFSKRIFIAVTGMTPQIVTETLYSLVIDHAFIPTDIYLITTLGGKKALINRSLFESFNQFCEDYDLVGKINFSEDNIKIITDSAGNNLEDISTYQDNQRAADTITNIIREACSDPDSIVHVSMAGGRKTMGFFAGYALSLFAREQDSLSHVLVSKELEDDRSFAYPRPNDEKAKQGVFLATIPLVKLRAGLTQELLTKQNNYEDAVKLAQLSITADELIINIKKKSIICNGTEIKLSPNEFAIYYFFAKYAKNKRPIILSGSLVVQDNDYKELKQRINNQIIDFVKCCQECKHAEEPVNIRNNLKKLFIDPENNDKYHAIQLYEFFKSHITRMKKKINDKLGSSIASKFIISDSKIDNDNKKYYQLNIDNEIIKINSD